MKNALLILIISLSAKAYAEIPQQVICSNRDITGDSLFHSFEFTRSQEDIYPAHYYVRVYISKTKDSGLEPDTPVDETFKPDETVVLDRTYSARGALNDDQLVYFNSSGFWRMDRTSGNTFAVSFQLPETEQDIAQYVENCHIPEPRAGGGN